MGSYAKVRAERKPLQVSVEVPLRPDLADEIAQLERRMKLERQVDQRENRIPVAPQLAERVQQLEVDLAASAITVTFVGIGRRTYNNLLAEHPPTQRDQDIAAGQGSVAMYDLEAFPPTLMFHACVIPDDWSLEDWTDVWENWGEGQVTKLWRACVAAQNAAGDVGPKSLIASNVLHEFGQSSTTAGPGESPARSS